MIVALLAVAVYFIVITPLLIRFGVYDDHPCNDPALCGPPNQRDFP